MLRKTQEVVSELTFFCPSLAHPLRFFSLVPLAVDKLNNRAGHRALEGVGGELSFAYDCIPVCIFC